MNLREWALLAPVNIGGEIQRRKKETEDRTSVKFPKVLETGRPAESANSMNLGHLAFNKPT